MRDSTAYVFFENLICQFTDKFLSLSFFGQASTLLVILSKAKNLKSLHYVKDDSSRITIRVPNSHKTSKQKNRGTSYRKSRDSIFLDADYLRKPSLATIAR